MRFTLAPEKTKSTRGRPRGHTPETIALVRAAWELRRKGLIEERIASHLEVTRQRVNQLLSIGRKLGIVPENAPRKCREVA